MSLYYTNVNSRRHAHEQPGADHRDHLRGKIALLSSVAFSIAAGIVLSKIMRDAPSGLAAPGAARSRAFLLGACLLLLVLSVVTVSRNSVWESDLALFRATVEQAPRNEKARL